MARIVKPRKQRTPPSTPLQAMLEEYIESLAVKGFTDDTRHVRHEHLSLFERWAMERGLSEPVEVTRPVLERYQRYLFHYRKKDGCPLSFASQHSRLSPLRMWFRWMTRQNYLLHNPASEIELPRLSKSLPHVLTAAEAELILQQPNAADPLGIRDRAMLELFYSTGVRRTELCRLELSDLNTERQTIHVRLGKGNKDRMVPVGERAVQWLEHYLQAVRPRLCLDTRTQALFLTGYGGAFNPDVVSRMVAVWIKQVTGRVASCHLLRHTCATHMLENGADIRFIQQLLGHEKLDTTAIYTEVSIKQLQEVHARCHPSAKLEKPLPLPPQKV